MGTKSSPTFIPPRASRDDGRIERERGIRRDSEQQLAAIVAVRDEISIARRSPQSLMELLVERALQLTLATGASLALLNGNELVYRAARGDSARRLGKVAPISTDLGGLSAQSGLVVRIDDARQDGRITALDEMRAQMRSILLVPLFHRRRVLGVLELVAREPDAFEERDVHATQLMAELMAAVIGHAAESEMARGALKTTEARLEANFRALIDASPDMIFIHRDERIVYVNRATLVGLRYDTSNGLIGTSILDLVAPEDRDTVRERIGRMREGAVEPREVALRRKDGEWYAVESVGTSVMFDGHPAVVAICRDISARKRLEAQLLLADRMATIGMLAAGVAHEINNPLAYITANLDLALESTLLRSEPELRDMLGEAREGAKRVQHIVRGLKSLSRGEEGTTEVVEIRPVIESAINMAWNEIRHRARLVKNYGEAPRVEAIEGRLAQVVLNLLVNAAQAIPAGDADRNEIRVTTRTDQSGGAVIEISDTGPGIPAEILPRLFDPFFTTKPAGVGTGLGLSISQGIVTALGGKITVDSVVGRGTVFRVSLPGVPSRTAPVVAVSSALAEAPPAKHGRVLIIDDDPLVLRSLVRTLSGQGTQVATASRARDALERIRSGEDFDVILCDLMMPEMSGLEFYAALAEVAPEARARVIFVSGDISHGGPSEKVPSLTIEKPFNVRELRSLIDARIRVRGAT